MYNVGMVMHSSHDWSMVSTFSEHVRTVVQFYEDRPLFEIRSHTSSSLFSLELALKFLCLDGYWSLPLVYRSMLSLKKVNGFKNSFENLGQSLRYKTTAKKYTSCEGFVFYICYVLTAGREHLFVFRREIPNQEDYKRKTTSADWNEL